METLKQYTPAEVYVIRENAASRLQEMLKLTLADLCLKRVLQIEERFGDDEGNEPGTGTKYLAPGVRFPTYKAKPHEKVFLTPFVQDPELEIPIKQYIKVVRQNAGNRKRYVHDLIFQNQQLQAMFQSGFWARLFGSLSLNDRGLNIKAQVDKELGVLEEMFPQLIASDKKRAKELLAAIGGNVFLLTSFDFELLKEIDQELAKDVGPYGNDDTWMWAGWWLLFDDAGEFDSAFDSAGGAVDGGDSGCSGCSGCGGCGGCGG